MSDQRRVEWKVHLPNLLAEVMKNPTCAILLQPVNITRSLLSAVAARAIELDDPKLHALMLRLTLYEQADPSSKSYDPKLLPSIEEILG